MTRVPPAVLHAVEQRIGARIASAADLGGRGFTPALRHRLGASDGRTFFLKTAADDGGPTAEWLRTEQVVYGHLNGRAFLPGLAGSGDCDGRPWLLLQDLGDAGWPPPWEPGAIAAVWSALDAVHAAPAPPGIRRLGGESPLMSGWRIVAYDPAPLLATGVCGPGWLERHLPILSAASRSRHILRRSEQVLLHLDVRSDNICITSRRAVLVDWDWAAIGDPRIDAALWLPTLAMETERAPDDPGLGAPALPPTFPAMAAGYYACHAGLPDIPDAPRALAQLKVALPWAARALGLPHPAGTA